MEKTAADQTYLALLKYVLTEGEARDDRTGTGTISVPAYTASYDISNNTVLMLGTKKTFIKTAIDEQVRFARGQTDMTGLSIWKQQTDRAWLDAHGMSDFHEGDLGYGYAFQYRHFGGLRKKGEDGMYLLEDGKPVMTEHKGVDQFAKVLHQLRHDPYSRRIQVTAMNPAQEHQMALPPCHNYFAFYVEDPDEGDEDRRKHLSISFLQRSCDIGLGVPFNIFNYSLLCAMFAHLTGMRTKTLTHMMLNAHVYSDHVDTLWQQVREGEAAELSDKTPHVRFKDSFTSFDDLTVGDIEILDKVTGPVRRMKMSK